MTILVNSQTKTDKRKKHHPPRIDSCYNFAYEISPKPDGPLYEYYYSSKTDTLTFVQWNNNERTIQKIKLSSKDRNFLIKKGIETSEKIKFDTSHKPVRHSFSVVFQITHNFINKAVYIQDKFYFDKISDFLVQFNNMLPKKAQFEINNFSFAENKSEFIKPDTTMTIDLDYYVDSLHKKDKYLISYASKKPSVTFSYFDTIENKKKFKDPITIKPEILRQLQNKSIAYINSFYYQGKLFTRTNDNFEIFTIAYSVPGLFIEAKINSIEMAKKDEKAFEFLHFLNSNLDNKYQFD